MSAEEADSNKVESDIGDVVHEELPSDSTLKSTDQALRERLVLTAVKFLQNSNVVNSSLKEKQTFLQKKGLTDAEITSALLRAQRELDVLQHVPATPGQSGQARHWAVILALFGGTAYGCYRFYKEMLIPFLTGVEPEAHDTLHKILTKHTDSLSVVTCKLEELQQACDKNSQKIDQLQTSTTSGASREIKELKDELSSLKRLLLGRHQFPQNPVVKPVIPTWQLEMDQSEKAQSDAHTRRNSDLSNEGSLSGSPLTTSMLPQDSQATNADNSTMDSNGLSSTEDETSTEKTINSEYMKVDGPSDRALEVNETSADSSAEVNVSPSSVKVEVEVNGLSDILLQSTS